MTESEFDALKPKDVLWFVKPAAQRGDFPTVESVVVVEKLSDKIYVKNTATPEGEDELFYRGEATVDPLKYTGSGDPWCPSLHLTEKMAWDAFKWSLLLLRGWACDIVVAADAKILELCPNLTPGK